MRRKWIPLLRKYPGSTDCDLEEKEDPLCIKAIDLRIVKALLIRISTLL
jgi:hypothetical protein